MTEHLDLLELELRRLPGVACVGYFDRADDIVVQVVSGPGGDLTTMRLQAEELCRARLEKPFTVELAGGSRPARVRLLGVLTRVVDPEEDGDREEVEVHLGYDGMRTIGRGAAGDPVGAAHATFEALHSLGARVPFAVQAAALFEHEVGEGVMLVLGSPDEGERYGVAAGQSVEQAAVRATLHALNRYLAAQSLPSPA